jgi:hypothetical protein
MALLPYPAVKEITEASDRDAGNPIAVRKEPWVLLGQILCLGSGDHTPIFEDAIAKAWTMGARPFEVIAGTPHCDYGPRITFSLPSEKNVFSDIFGVPDHPWGQPQWMGLRMDGSGKVIAKLYHRLKVLPLLPVPNSVARDLYPVMASRLGKATEIYARFSGLCEWQEFVTSCISGLGFGGKFAADYSPWPKARRHSFGASFRFSDDCLISVTVFADQLALPDDETIRAAWVRDMSALEIDRYELTYAVVRSLGRRRLGGWHAALGWSVDAEGRRNRAASLRSPVITCQP